MTTSEILNLPQLDNLYKMAIAILLALQSRLKMKDYNNALVAYDAFILSSLSELNVEFSIVVNDIAVLQKKEYLDKINTQAALLKTIPIGGQFNSDLINLINLIVKRFSMLVSGMEENYDIENGSLDIYKETATETSLSLGTIEYIYYPVTQYYGGRSLINKTSDVIKTFSNIRTKIINNTHKFENSLAIKPDLLYNDISKAMQSLILSHNTITDLITACFIAVTCYDNAELSSVQDIQKFINEPFEQMKAKITNILRSVA